MTLKADYQSLSEMVIEQIHNASKRYHQLVLTIIHYDSELTDFLAELSKKRQYHYININLILSQALLNYSRRERISKVIPVLDELVSEKKGEAILLDNIEILFEPSIKQDPLRCLEQLSRNQTIVANWRGVYSNGTLTYSEPGHPEYKFYSDVDALVINLAQNNIF